MKDEQQSVKSFLDFVYNVYSQMQEREITLVYEGEITHQITKAFTSLAEMEMAKEEEESTVQRKVFHVMVECLQNVSKHADTPGLADYRYAGRGIFLVSRGENRYHVISGNLIEREKAVRLQENLEALNKMSKEELSTLYKSKMREGALSDKGGAGLGFIDIIRKTGNPLEFHFMDIDETHQFFVLTSTVSRK